jgi:hypothetical protein
MNLCCDETAMVRTPQGRESQETYGARSALE